MKIIRYIQKFLRIIKEEDSFGIAAQTAFFFLTALFPLLIMAGWLLDTLHLSLDTLEGFLPAEFISLFAKESNITLPMRGPVPALLTLWGASAAVWSLMKGVNRAYNGNRLASVKARLMALAYTIAFLTVLGGTLFFTATGRFGNLIMVALATYLLLFALYAYIPGTPKRFRRAGWTALAVTVCWIALSSGFALYMRYFANYNVLYGSLGAFLGLSLWVFALCFVIILGAEIGAMVMKDG